MLFDGNSYIEKAGSTPVVVTKICTVVVTKIGSIN